MEKRKIRVMITLTYAVALTASAMLGGSTQCAELALLQDAMRELRRTDNLEFSYENVIAKAGSVKSEKVVVWADQLSGSWVSEHYTTDEDGTRLYVKRFCDGLHVYDYLDWNGEWELQEEVSTEIPYLAQVIDLPYDSDDIMDIALRQKVDVQELSYAFTSSYIEAQNRKRQQTLEEYYADYQKMHNSKEEAENIALAVAQYRQTRETNTTVVYRIDSVGVMRGFNCCMTLVAPEVVYDSSGQQVLGEEYESTYETRIEISRYNQDGILNKIAQCGNEVSYYQCE